VQFKPIELPTVCSKALPPNMLSMKTSGIFVISVSENCLAASVFISDDISWLPKLMLGDIPWSPKYILVILPSHPSLLLMIFPDFPSLFW
jgi:hypothetical protein